MDKTHAHTHMHISSSDIKLCIYSEWELEGVFHNQLRNRFEGFTPTHIETNACNVLFYALKEIPFVAASVDASQIGRQ